jgi:uncharacterized protein YjbI with pentapeptide repeats
MLKKIIIVIISITIILLGIEGYVDYSIAELDACGLEKHEVFKDLPQDTKKQRCHEIFGLGYVFDRVEISRAVIHTNSDGFRGTEITLEKPENTYRIFTVGGSTTYGDGIEDSGTYPFYLQKKFDQMDLDFDVQVINAGIPAAFSHGEVKLIKNRLLQYEPDLFVVYDGWNDSSNHMKGNTDENKWFDRWKEICNLGNDKGFDVVVTIQPLAGTGNRIITQQEYEGYLSSKTETSITELYPLYLKKLQALNEHCTKTADLRGIFDNVAEPIYYDNGHQGARGSQTIAENMFKLILPIMTGDNDTMEDNIESAITKPFYKTPYLISHLGSVEHFISTMPEKLDWTQTSFLYRNYSGQDIRNSILWDAENIRGYFAWSNLANTNLSEVDLSGWNLRGTVLEGADLRGANLDGTELRNANLNNAKLEGAIWKPEKDLRNTNMAYTNLSGFDLSSYNFSGTNLTGSDLTNTTLHNTILGEANFTDADLSGVDFTKAYLAFGVEEWVEHDDGIRGKTGVKLELLSDVYSFKAIVAPIFTDSDLSNAVLSNMALGNSKFNYADAKNVDFSGSVFVLANFQNANLKNTNFQNSIFHQVDFSNAILTGADFSGVIMYESIFDDKDLDCINHPVCDYTNTLE